MLRTSLALLLILCLLTGCAMGTPRAESVTWLDLFDTVATLRGFDNPKGAFADNARLVHDSLLEYHRLFDIYNDYDGMNNLKTVNDNAGIQPVQVDRKIIDLLTDCREYCRLTGGKVNAAMGSVLQLWHEKREEALLAPEKAGVPDTEALARAAEHCSFDTVIIDEENSTVFISDPMQRLDVGAVAKGWTVQRVSATLPEGYLIDLGCNICATGPKPGGSSWIIGVQSPENADALLGTLELASGSAVTSGDYWRYYEVDGQRYHHIIDPGTLYPAMLWRSVTILCPDSGLADCLSTALFLMDRQQGLALLEQVGAQAMWVSADGNTFSSPGFGDFMTP